MVSNVLSRNLAFWSKLAETYRISTKYLSVSKFTVSDEIHVTDKKLAIDSHSSLHGEGNGQ